VRGINEAIFPLANPSPRSAPLSRPLPQGERGDIGATIGTAIWTIYVEEMNKIEPLTSDKETRAHQLVGQFLQNFALMEQALDSGISKLLGLDGGKADIVCSSIPFAKKVGVFFSAEGLLAKMPDGRRKLALKSARSKIMELNNKRLMFAHNPFLAESDGISFRRVVADTKLAVSNVILTKHDVSGLCDQAANLVTQLDNLVEEMQPYTPSLDFSDPRNSAYVTLIL
jgi:hypothetical protein